MNKKEKRGVLIAGSIGFLVVFGVIALRKLLNDKNYDTDYYDFHGNLYDEDEDENHGVEFLAMK